MKQNLHKHHFNSSGVPQGIVLCLKLFITYKACKLNWNYAKRQHSGAFKVNRVPVFVTSFTANVNVTALWTRRLWLKMNLWSSVVGKGKGRTWPNNFLLTELVEIKRGKRLIDCKELNIKIAMNLLSLCKRIFWRKICTYLQILNC